MYIPPHDREDRLDVLQAFMRENPLAALVTLGPDGLTASHVPLRLYPELGGPSGTLRGHLARPNRQWQAFTPEVEALVIFQGVQAYISPSWYVAKQETGRVVPTWNYLVVHARGPLRIIDDPAWLREQVTDLTDGQEAAFASPWQVADAPDAYIEAQLRGIVGIEIPISHIEGRWKLSQNRNAADRQGVIDGLTEQGCPEMAGQIAHRSSSRSGNA